MPTVALIRAELCLDEPGGVSVPAPPRREDIDLAVDRDPCGRPHIPGTTLAGGLRAMVVGYGGDHLAARLFGHLVYPDPARDTVDAVASPIWVLGTRPLPAAAAKAGPGPDAGGDDDVEMPTRVRQMTAIDRKRGAARASTLRREEVLPAGTRFEIFLRWDDPRVHDLELFLAHLCLWRPLIGHSVSRGRGRVHVQHARYRLLDLADRADLAEWLCGHGPDLLRRLAVQRPPRAVDPTPGPRRLDVPVNVVGPLRVGNGIADPSGECGPKVLQIFRDGDRIVLPGSGLKGLLRSRCEFILRSINAKPDPCLDQRCRQCWPCRVFGHGGGDDPGEEAVGWRSRVRVLDAAVTDPVTVTRTHVAIDRFTGGAGDQHLFTVHAVESGTFHLVVEVDELGEPESSQFRALLRLVLEDLADGLIGVGAGVARGYGTVTPDVTTADLPTVAQARVTLQNLIAEEVTV
jgi:CRISPR/Cas system CSM-associated protein Csm3 (group 7 of RAMP superfamily)